MSHLVPNYLFLLAFVPALALAQPPEVKLVIKDHHFSPAELKVPANTKVKLLVENQDATPEEFESHDLNREKVIQGRSRATVYVGPLQPGRYRFFGEFHEATAQGAIIAE
jgi:plastocyanin